MKPTEAAALLTIAAAYDNRKPDADQAKAWAMALEGIRFEDAREAVVNHYKRSREWLMPVEVIEGVQHIRAERLRNFRGSFTPPAELADNPAAEMDWIRDRKRRVMDGERVEDAEPVGAIQGRDVAALGQIGRTVPRPARTPTPRHPAHTPAEEA